MPSLPEAAEIPVALACAWNEIMHVRGELPKDLFDRVTGILIELDKVIIELHPPMVIEPIAVCDIGCRFCGSHGHG